MGKAKLKGKGRREKYFYLAKEVGYRARSSFKLIQLNKKFNFLQESKVLVDLCAAPGSWLQVAAEHMPMQSVILGVDLDEIKPLRGVQTFKDDITTDSCRNKIKAELHGWTVDCFLHDGAPNVGKNWLFDAFQQSVLTLAALKMACTFLRKGGWFITKVFRSKDYQALLWVFNQLFHKVHSTKPSASRDTSAEIFVVCSKFKYDSIKKIDKKFFDARSVFEEVEERRKAITVMDFEPKKRKAKGYADEFQDMVYEEMSIDDFLASTGPLSFLKKATKVVMVVDGGDAIDVAERQKELQLDDDMLECLKDTKQCGKREVKQIIKWHAKTRKRLGLDIEEDADDEEEEEEELDSDAEMEKLVEKAEVEEAQEKRRKRKETHKKKLKINARRANLKHSGLAEDASEMFDLNQVKSKDDLGEIEGAEMDEEHPDTEDEAQQQPEEQQESDESDEEEYEVEEESSSEEEEEVEANPLLVTEKKVGADERWFENSAFDDIEDEADDIAQAAKYYEHKEKALAAAAAPTAIPSSKKRGAQTEYHSDGSDSEYELLEQAGGGVKRTKLDPVDLALGTAIATSHKSKMAMVDGSFNRYMFDDEANALPDWFVENEDKRVVRTNLEEHVDNELVNYYKEKGRNINDRTIKKVVEAKFRKRYHHMKKLEKANKQASSITDNTDMSNKEKAVQLKALYKKSGLSKKKEHTTYVYARKGMGARVRRPAGVQGRFKVVDKRMKKELRVKKKKASAK